MTGEICGTIALIGDMTGGTFTPTAAICTAIDATCGTTFAIAITATRDMTGEAFAMISVIQGLIIAICGMTVATFAMTGGIFTLTGGISTDIEGRREANEFT